MPGIQKIVSGGQTGVDRGALDAARALGTAIGGWVPKGRRAEDGRVPDEYPLQETATAEYEERTRLNVYDSDGTLILSHGPLRGGSQVTLEAAVDLGRPHKHLDLSELSPTDAIEKAIAWIGAHHIETLNVAGPRQSEDPDAYRMSRLITTGLLTRTDTND